MLILLILLKSQALACRDACRSKCRTQDFSSSCLSSCGCSTNLDLNTWDCPGETIKNCEKASNIEKCLKKSNCKPKSQVFKLEIRQNNEKLLKNVKNLEKLPEIQTKKVTCQDCRILEGDDYWECVAEYCESWLVDLKKCDCKAGDWKCRKTCSNAVLLDEGLESIQLKKCSDCSYGDFRCLNTCTYDIAKNPGGLISKDSLNDETLNKNFELVSHSMNFLTSQPRKQVKYEKCIQKCCQEKICNKGCLTACEEENSASNKNWEFLYFPILILLALVFFIKLFKILTIRSKTSEDLHHEYLIVR